MTENYWCAATFDNDNKLQTQLTMNIIRLYTDYTGGIRLIFMAWNTTSTAFITHIQFYQTFAFLKGD